MEYYTEIREDDSTVVPHDFTIHIADDATEADDVHSTTVAQDYAEADDLDADENYAEVINSLQGAEQLVLNLLAKESKAYPKVLESELTQQSEPNAGTASNNKRGSEHRPTSVPASPHRPSSAGPARSKRASHLNPHRMLAAYGVVLSSKDHHPTNHDDSASRTSSASSGARAPPKSTILAWSDSYSLNNTSRTGYSSAYDYNYHHSTYTPQPEDLRASIEGSKARLAISKRNARIHRSTSDDCVMPRNAHRHDPREVGSAYVLNNYQIQTFDTDDDESNYSVYEGLLSKERREHSKKGSPNARRRLRAEKQQAAGKWAYTIDQSLAEAVNRQPPRDTLPASSSSGGAKTRQPFAAAHQAGGDPELALVNCVLTEVFAEVFDGILNSAVGIILRNRPNSSPRGFRCGAYLPKKPDQKGAEKTSTEGANIAATAAAAAVQTQAEIEGGGRRSKPSALSELVQPRRTSVVAHTQLIQASERRRVIENYTYVSKTDHAPLPHVKQLLYDLQLRINAHKAHG